ncbi:helix-turn-helix domain-containing protein [Phormidium sp. CCY1219]|uniref:helix-turn-helix domain-containing protein n=1 Tax=Phormidium sp. CCY1219 TaxID=2886104 RepID=UPI002D1E7B50|nr:helix-turn-helix domain-containing protein [Phormidium sp. CCY1219]MEB3827973.1 helix-turn-helix domain-containing protein [Phormidium sp. CCY1219]
MTGSNPAFGFSPSSASNSRDADNSGLDPTSDRSNPLEITRENGEETPHSAIAAVDPQQAWETALRQVGEELQQVRLDRGISLYQLHAWTYVPLDHIKAIENGTVESLPPAIFVRGFVRRLGDALGLSGSEIADSLPEITPHQTLANTSEEFNSASGFSLSPIHLYVGYAAILVTAVAGLTWITGQVSAESSPTPASGTTLESTIESEE